MRIQCKLFDCAIVHGNNGTCLTFDRFDYELFHNTYTSQGIIIEGIKLLSQVHLEMEDNILYLPGEDDHDDLPKTTIRTESLSKSQVKAKALMGLAKMHKMLTYKNKHQW